MVYEIGGLREKLEVLAAEHPKLETVFLWTPPEYFMKQSLRAEELDKLDKRYFTESKSENPAEKLGSFLLHVLCCYYKRRLFNKKFEEEITARIRELEDADVDEDMKTGFIYVLKCTMFCMDSLNEAQRNSRIPEALAAENAYIEGLKGWYYMKTFEHRRAVEYFNSCIRKSMDCGHIYGYWMGKTLGRNRRARGDRICTVVEVDMLLEGNENPSCYPTILMGLDNYRESSPQKFEEEYKEIFQDLLNKAVTKVDEYQATDITRIAMLHQSQGDTTECGRLLELAHKLNPACSLTAHKLGVYLIESDRERAEKLLMEANHIPAFEFLLKNSDPSNIPQVLERLEAHVENINLSIRYVLYLYYSENKKIAKASYHLKQIVQQKYTVLEVVKFFGKRRSLKTLLSLSMEVPRDVNVKLEAERFGKKYPDFQDWLEHQHHQQQQKVPYSASTTNNNYLGICRLQ